MNILICDECKKEFTMEVKEEMLKENIYKMFFTCPHCNKEYIPFYTNVLIKIKQQKIKKIQERYNKLIAKGDIGQSTKLFKQYEKLKKEIGKDMESLKKRVELW